MLAWLKQNWYLPVLVIGLALLLALLRPAPESPGEGDAPGDAADAPARDSRQQALRAEFDAAKAAAESRGTETERTPDVIIAEHEEKLEADPPPEEAAAHLAALGNLYRQKKGDYATAARYFERVIENHPDWPGIRGVYHQLMACYTELEDQESLRRLYRRMVEVFPDDSNEHAFAQHALDNP